MAVEAVKWTGMNHEELISAFDMEILDFGYNEDVYVGETHAYPGNYLVKSGDEIVVFGEKQFKAIFTEEQPMGLQKGQEGTHDGRLRPCPYGASATSEGMDAGAVRLAGVRQKEGEGGMKTLTLSLKKKWFDMIKSGEKKEEYREICDYWGIRFAGRDVWANEFCIKDVGEIALKHFDRLVFTLGYPKADDTERRLTFKNPKIRIGTGRTEWGAEPGKQYFVITWEA